MRITSWNVNGLKSIRPLAPLFEALDSDIICLQETKISGPGDPELESIAFVEGYDSFFSICKQKRGYSGVATFCRKKVATPHDAGEGFCNKVGGAAIDTPKSGGVSPPQRNCTGDDAENPHLPFNSETLEIVKDEGRCVITDHRSFVLINIYVPALTVIVRETFKIQFLHALRAKIDALQRIGRKVIVVGDFNICPSLRDRAEPVLPSELDEWHQSPTRAWLRTLLETNNMVDSFRECHPTASSVYTCWSEATKSRENNHGVRIDLIVVSREFFTSSVTEAAVWSHIQGSDHCPVTIRLREKSNTSICSKRLPSFCTQNMRRFAFRQQSLTSLFARRGQECSTSVAPPINFAGKVRKPSKRPVERSLRGFGQSGSKGDKLMGSKKRKGRYTQTSLLALTQAKDHIGRSECAENLSSVHRGATPRSVSMNDRDDLSQECTKADGVERTTGVHEGPEFTNRRRVTSEAWRKLLTGPPPTPRCRHGELCVVKKVSKSGENRGKTFFSCPYPAGIGKTANCNFFQWAPFRAGFEPS